MSDEMAKGFWVSGVSRTFLTEALAEGIGISVPHAETLCALLTRQGERLSFEELRSMLGRHRPVKVPALYERISYLRRVMGHDAIGGYRPPRDRQVKTPRGSRWADAEYFLSEAGLQKCRDALERVACLLPLRQVEASIPLRTPAKAAN